MGTSRLVRSAQALKSRELPADIATVLILLMSTFHLVAHNGGRGAGSMLWVLVVAASGTLLLIPTLRRASPAVVWLFAAWSLTPLVVLLDAEIRAGALRPLSAAALAPAVALATLHMWRRPWGPAAVGIILALTAARSWYLTFLAWWGGSLGRPTWLALSWHNQSGTLMGTLGVAAMGTATALAGRPAGGSDAQRATRAAQLVAVALAGVTLAGAWLSGSRGAVAATALGVVAVIIALARGGELRRAAPALAGVVVVTVLAVVGLETMVKSDVGQPLTTRDQGAAANMASRFGYWEAAVGMALSRPLTGWGPGSYPWASIPHYPDDTNLTSSAHNEYLEVLGEGGVVGAVPVWLTAIALAVLASAAILRRPHPPGSPGRRAGVIAAAGAVVLLGVHAGLDFDWDYPLLLALLAIGGAVLWEERRGRPADTLPSPYAQALIPSVVAVTSMGLLLGVALAGTIMGKNGAARWELNRPLAGAVAAVQAGDLPTARRHLDTARTWNPGAPSIPVVATVAEHAAGALSDSALAASVDAGTTSHVDQLLVARRLYQSENWSAAQAILEDLARKLEMRQRWGVRNRAVEVATLQLRIEAERSGCAAAEALLEPVRQWVANFDVEAAALQAALASAAEDSGCTLLDPSTADIPG